MTRKPLLWCRDLCSCLHATLATVIHAQGADPVTVLGSSFQFRYLEGHWRGEEFYFPCSDDDLGRVLAPQHTLEIVTRRAPDDDTRALSMLGERLEAGALPIAGVDNLHLPFRPAFGDLHAAHLLVVFGVDADADAVCVSDAIPPAFQGPIPSATFLRSWGSANPPDGQDPFFSSSPLERRWYDVRLVDAPAVDADWIARAIADGARELVAPSETDAGIPALERYVTALARRMPGDERDLALRELYGLGWNLQAQVGLHAEFLRRFGRELDVSELREAASAVDDVAHAWTHLRMTGAHMLVEGLDLEPQVVAAGRALVGAHERAADRILVAAAACGGGVVSTVAAA